MARRKRGPLKTLIALVCLLAPAAAIGYAGYRGWGDWSTSRRLAQGRAAYDRADWSEAVRVAEAVLRGHPENTGALVLLARTFARSGRDGDALDVYRRVNPEALQAQDHVLIGDALLEAGEKERSLASWLDAEKLDPDDPDALDRLASYYDHLKMPVEALARARKLANDPRLGIRGAWLEARLHEQLDEPEAAAQPLERVLNADESHLRSFQINRVEAALLAARVNLRLGRPDRALEVLDTGMGGEPTRESRWLTSRALLQQGKTREAEEALAAVSPAESPLRREPAPYTGAVSCRPCHGSNYASEQSSQHALTFEERWNGPAPVKSLSNKAASREVAAPAEPGFAAASGSAGAAASPSGRGPKSEASIADPAWSRVRHRLVHEGETTSMETTVADRTYRAIVQYLVGSGKHGQTPMVRDERGEIRECRLSYHPGRGVWTKTIDHPDAPPDALDYVGRRVSEDAAWQCVNCHTTTASSVLNPDLKRPQDHGIGCERCHGPGGNHVKAMELKFSDPAVARPSLATAAEVTRLCAECHREPAPGTAPGSPRFIRFQAPTFMKSRCFTESGSFSCVSCHDPHKNAGTSSAAYEAVCLDCHSAKKAGGPISDSTTEDAGSRAVCPVNPAEKCLSCHMPKVPEAVPNAEFTDHYIRIRKDFRSAAPRTARRP